MRVHKQFGSHVPAGRMSEISVAHPDRTAYRTCGCSDECGYVFQEWTSRGAMLTSIAMQERRAPSSRDWRDFQTSRLNAIAG